MSDVKPTLSSLPWDVRRMIYEHVFIGSQIIIEQDETVGAQARSPPRPPRTRIYRNTCLKDSLAALRTNRTIQETLLTTLASHTSLFLPASLHDPDTTIQGIPPVWRINIPTILHDIRPRSRAHPVLRQTHIPPTLFPNLKTYRVAHLVCPDWRDPPSPATLEPLVQQHLESEFFFQAGTLRLFARGRTYQLTTTLWLLRAADPGLPGWEVEFCLDTWRVLRATRCRFRRRRRQRRHRALRGGGGGGAGGNLGGTDLTDDAASRDWRDYIAEEVTERAQV